MRSLCHPRDDLLSHTEFVRGIARATLRGDPECEDLEQDVWERALRAAPEEPGRQRPWLVAVMRHRAVDLLRGRRRRRRREELVARPDRVPGAADTVERAETGRRLVDALLALEEPFRSAVLLRYQDGLPPRLVADRQGIPVETARSRIRRGLGRLRVALEEKGRRERRDERAALAALACFDPVRAVPIAALVGGALLVKKIAVALVAVLLLGAGGYLAFDLGGSRAVSERQATTLVADGAQAAGDRPMLTPPPRAEEVAASEVEQPAKPVSPRPRVFGRVVGEDGTPIAGARLMGAMEGQAALTEYLLRAEAEDVWRTTTDEQGRFDLEIPARSGIGGMTVLVYAQGWNLPGTPGMEGIHLTAGVESTVRLVRGTTLEVRVVDAATGAGILAAEVVAYRLPGHVLYTMAPAARGTCAEDGVCRLAIPGGPTRIVASADGFAQTEGESPNVGPEGAAIRVGLRRGGTLTAEVVDREGEPVPRALVALLRAPAVHRRATSDAEGIVRFENVAPASDDAEGVEALRIALLAAEADGFARTWLSAEPPPEGGERTVRLVLVRPRRVTGIVRYASGTPAVGARVSAATRQGRAEWGWSDRSSGSVFVQTDAEGRFEVSDVAPGAVDVSVALPAPGRYQSVLVTVPVDGPVAPVEVVIDSRAPVQVRVIDAEGRPVKGASVWVMPLSTHAAPMTSGTTGKDGLAAVVPEAEGPWWLVVDAPGAGPLLRRVEAEDAARGTVVEVRPGAGRIAGRAVRLDGSAARVRLGFTVTVPMPHGTSSLRTSQGTVETDAEGRFTFVGVHDGVSGLQTVTPGFRVVPTPGETFSSHAEDLRVLVVDEAEAAGLTLEVEVLDGATGEALTVRPDVRLRRAGDPGYAPAFSTPGRRSVHRSQDALATGPWEVEVHAEGYVTAKSEAHVAPGPAATRVVVRMERSR